MEMIVVGIDGSEGGEAALAFAAREAAVHKARLRVVTAWQTPYAAYTGGFMPPPDLSDTVKEGAEGIAARAADRAVELEPSVYCEHEAVEGHPAEVLTNESRNASLVVVGSRGHGSFASLLLGSTSHQVVQHAHCPVAIVPRPPAEED
jgi:nucleotide-binding universal stress UspA family protein